MNKSRVVAALAVVVWSFAGCVNVLDVGNASDASSLYTAEGDDLLDDFDDDDGFQLTHVIAARGPFSRVGLRFDAVGPVAVEVRTSADGARTFTPWQAATLTFEEGAAHNAFVDVATPSSTHLQLRFAAPIESQLTFLAVDAFALDDQLDEAVAGGGAEQALGSGSVITRESWGGRRRNCTSSQTPSIVTIHHTETPNNDGMSINARLRQIQNYHIDVRGWCDIGYHFLIGPDGKVYQGRSENTVGAHVAGANSGNVGIAFVGTFRSSPPPATMMDAAATLLGALHQAYAIELDAAHIKTHRQQGETDCPGRALELQIPNILEHARNEGPDPEPAAEEPSSSCDQVQVQGASTLNLRPSPSTLDAPVGTLSEGDVVNVLALIPDGQSVNGTTSWYQVQVSALNGFISGAYARCTADAAAPRTGFGGVYDGLDRGSAQIPRAGLSNDTLRNALGFSTEPYGYIERFEGHDYVRGLVSHFGGPNDSGVSSTETGAISGERLRALNNPLNASDATIAARPEDFYYAAMRWDYTPHGRNFWVDARILVVNPDNGLKVVLRPVDWGPNTSTGRILDVSPEALDDLDADTDDELLVSFAAAGAPLGVAP